MKLKLYMSTDVSVLKLEVQVQSWGNCNIRFSTKVGLFQYNNYWEGKEKP